MPVSTRPSPPSRTPPKAAVPAGAKPPIPSRPPATRMQIWFDGIEALLDVLRPRVEVEKKNLGRKKLVAGATWGPYAALFSVVVNLRELVATGRHGLTGELRGALDSLDVTWVPTLQELKGGPVLLLAPPAWPRVLLQADRRMGPKGVEPLRLLVQCQALPADVVGILRRVQKGLVPFMAGVDVGRRVERAAQGADRAVAKRASASTVKGATKKATAAHRPKRRATLKRTWRAP